MPPDTPTQRPPLVVPIILIVVGALFLYANYRPAFDPWLVLKTYWPLILIFIGLGKMLDSMACAAEPERARGLFDRRDRCCSGTYLRSRHIALSRARVLQKGSRLLLHEPRKAYRGSRERQIRQQFRANECGSTDH